MNSTSRLPPKRSLHESPSLPSPKLKFDYHPPPLPPPSLDLYFRRNTDDLLAGRRREEVGGGRREEGGWIGGRKEDSIGWGGGNREESSRWGGSRKEEGASSPPTLDHLFNRMNGAGVAGGGGGLLFDKIMKIVEGKFESLENRLMKNEEGVLANEGMLRGHREEVERVARLCRENEKIIEKGLTGAEQGRREEEEERGRKMDALIAKITSVESRVQLIEDKLNRFQNQMEMKMSGVTQELQSTLNKVIKQSRDINGKIETIYESPQLIFQKLIADYERNQVVKNPVDFDQKLLMISDDFKSKMKDVYKNLDEVGLWAKRNNEEFSDQKNVLAKIEEDFLRLLTFYKDLNEDMIRVKAGQEDLIFLKTRLGELEGTVEKGWKNRR